MLLLYELDLRDTKIAYVETITNDVYVAMTLAIAAAQRK